MKTIKDILLYAAFLLSVTVSAAAGATPITLSSLTFTTGTGYGDGNDLLDVTFAAASAPSTINLAAGGSFSFKFGTITLNETCINPLPGCPGGNGNDETDNLGVTAVFHFTSPLSSNVQDVAIVGAVTGLVSDTAVDYTIDFAPFTVAFGSGGVLSIDLSDLHFSDTGAIDTNATVTLVSAPVSAGSVPEPATMALFGLGLVVAGLARRRMRPRA